MCDERNGNIINFHENESALNCKDEKSLKCYVRNFRIADMKILRLWYMFIEIELTNELYQPLLEQISPHLLFVTVSFLMNILEKKWLLNSNENN